MFIPDPGSDFFPSRIPDPNCLHPGSRILIKEFKYFNPKKSNKMVSKLLKNMIRVVHPGSRIRMLTFSHPGSRIQGVKKHPIPDPDPQHWFPVPFFSSSPFPKKCHFLSFQSEVFRIRDVYRNILKYLCANKAISFKLGTRIRVSKKCHIPQSVYRIHIRIRILMLLVLLDPHPDP